MTQQFGKPDKGDVDIKVESFETSVAKALGIDWLWHNAKVSVAEWRAANAQEMVDYNVSDASPFRMAMMNEPDAYDDLVPQNA